MAKIEDLMTEIRWPLAERDRPCGSSTEEAKKFGLVFEEHIPETVQLPSLPVKAGLRVIRRGGSVGKQRICGGGAKRSSWG